MKPLMWKSLSLLHEEKEIGRTDKINHPANSRATELVHLMTQKIVSGKNKSVIWCLPCWTYRNIFFARCKIYLCYYIHTCSFHPLSYAAKKRNKLGLKTAQVFFSLTPYWRDSGPEWHWKESEDAPEITEATCVWKVELYHLSIWAQGIWS